MLGFGVTSVAWRAVLPRCLDKSVVFLENRHREGGSEEAQRACSFSSTGLELKDRTTSWMRSGAQSPIIKSTGGCFGHSGLC